MQRIIRAFILLVMVNLTAAFITAQSQAETPVIGFIAQDTTWTQANSPYVTLGSIIVKEGATLTIEPGIAVQFDSGHSLTIEGTLIARGTDKQSIKFTPKGEQKPGAWDGIVFEDSSIDAKFDDAGNYVSGSILQYCTVEFAETAVKANSASPFVDHCVISNNASGGISISEGDIVVIQNNVIADNTSYNTRTGDKFKGWRERMRYSIGGAISVIESNTITISKNTLTGNIGGGIYIEGGTVTISNNILSRNIVTTSRGNSYGGGIGVRGSSTAIIKNNTLRDNKAIGGDAYFDSGNIGRPSGAGYGGGIYTGPDTIVTISNNILSENAATGGLRRTNARFGSISKASKHRGHGYGGGICSEGGTVTISYNTLRKNTATGGEGMRKEAGRGGDGLGGGIYIYMGTATINDNTLIGNTATGGAGGSAQKYAGDGAGSGGGICSEGGTVTISNNILSRNMAIGYHGTPPHRYGGTGGGICVVSGGDGTSVNNNIVTGNAVGVPDSSGKTASNRGGGIYIYAQDAIAIINGNIITENYYSGMTEFYNEEGGAAIYWDIGSLEISDNLIANNVGETAAVCIRGKKRRRSDSSGGNLTGNTIIDNQTKYNLYYFSTSVVYPNLNATNNYWGLTNEAEIRLTIYDFFINNNYPVVDVAPFLVENPLPLRRLTLAVSPKTLPADATSTATITAMLEDSKGNPVVDEHLTMLVSQGTGKLSEVKNNKDGTYTATYTASREAGVGVVLVVAPYGST